MNNNQNLEDKISETLSEIDHIMRTRKLREINIDKIYEYFKNEYSESISKNKNEAFKEINEYLKEHPGKISKEPYFFHDEGYVTGILARVTDI
jgi:hypothetical protein